MKNFKTSFGDTFLFTILLVLTACLLLIGCGEDGEDGVTPNQTPVANAGLDQTVSVDDTVTLDGSGSSDADEDPLTYQWSFVSRPGGSAATLSYTTAVNPTFEVDVAGTYVVQLIVNDGTADSDPDTVTITAVTSNIVVITENIDSNTTWEGDKIYVIEAWDFYVNATLVVEAGAIIKFHPTEGPYLVLGGTGTITANGAPDNPIIFTSYKDDSHGGDTNGDGDATTPDRLDWGYVNTNGLHGSVFDYCEFYYGGDSAYSATLALEGSRATVTNCTFAHNDGSDSTGWYGALDASSAISGTIITGNVFHDNVRPLAISIAFDMDDSNVFHNPDDPSQTNTYNGIFVDSFGGIANDRTWEETEVAFVIDDNDFWIHSGGTLTLADNVVLKFRPGSELVLDRGASDLVNHDGTGVYFTSYKDDTRKGDTNGDDTTTPPGKDDWIGIYDNAVPIPGPYHFTWGNIWYDGYSGNW